MVHAFIFLLHWKTLVTMCCSASCIIYPSPVSPSVSVTTMPFCKLSLYSIKTDLTLSSSTTPYKMFYWPVGAAAEWHLSSKCAHTPHRCEFIWFDRWCVAHVFTGACVVEPRSWFQLSLANTRTWLSRTSSAEGVEEGCPLYTLGSSQNIFTQLL